MTVVLADKSAYSPLRYDADFLRRLEEGEIATSAIVDLEILYSAESGRVYDETFERRAAMPRVRVTEESVARALEVQGLMGADGRHRHAGIVDLLIAAAAERAGVPVLTADRGFERIARYTGQPVEVVAPSDGAGDEVPEQTYLVLADDGGCWRELGEVRAISHAVALAVAAEKGLNAERRVVVDLRHWKPAEA